MSIIHVRVGLSTKNFEFRIILVNLDWTNNGYNVCALQLHTQNNPNHLSYSYAMSDFDTNLSHYSERDMKGKVVPLQFMKVYRMC
jgi:hypothetical protein